MNDGTGRHLTRHLRPNVTKIMIVYSRAQGVVRKIHDADHDDEYDHHTWAHLHYYAGRDKPTVLRDPIRDRITRKHHSYLNPRTGKTIQLVRGAELHPDGGHEAHEQHPGKGILYLSHAEYDALDGPALAEFVGRHAGFGGAPEHGVDRHAICHPDGTVVGACLCDPACGDHGDHVADAWGLPRGVTLVKHEHAGEGWKHRNGILTPPEA